MVYSWLNEPAMGEMYVVIINTKTIEIMSVVLLIIAL